MNTRGALYGEVKQSITSQYGPNARNEKHLNLAEKYVKEADNFFQTNHYWFAVESYELALAINIQIEPCSMNVGAIQIKLGKCWTKMGDLEKAIHYYSKALKIHSKIPGTRSAEYHRSCHEELGKLYFLTGDNDQALVHKGEALRISLVLYNRKNQITANAYCSLGEFLMYNTADQFILMSPTHYPNVSRKAAPQCLVDEKKWSLNQLGSSSENNFLHGRTLVNPAKKNICFIKKTNVDKHKPLEIPNILLDLNLRFAHMRLHLACFYLSEAILINGSLRKNRAELHPTFKQFKQAMAREQALEDRLKSQNTARRAVDQATTNENAIPTITSENTDPVSLDNAFTFNSINASSFSNELSLHQAQNKIISALSSGVTVKIKSGIQSMR